MRQSAVSPQLPVSGRQPPHPFDAAQAGAPTTARPSVSDVERFLETLLGDLDLEPAGPPGPGRPRVIPALVLWGALITCVLEGQPSQRAIWRVSPNQTQSPRTMSCRIGWNSGVSSSPVASASS